MSLFGAGFMQDDVLVKWGDGATRNAIMALAAHAVDMPFFIDNFKPSTGGGARDFINLIHHILEGGDKDRMSRAAVLRETKRVSCWPLMTGEDVPDHDPASLARILVVAMPELVGPVNPTFTKTQQLAPHLAAVGRLWIEWLETDDGATRATEAAELFPSYRAAWGKVLRATRTDMVNVLRMASNLASNQLTWEVLTRHPVIGPVVKPHTKAHTEGLESVAMAMANYTAESLEASRYLVTLRELITSGRYILTFPLVIRSGYPSG
jgi:hypothetical protein